MAHVNTQGMKISIYIDKETNEALQYLKKEGMNISGTLQKLVRDKAAALKAFNAAEAEKAK